MQVLNIMLVQHGVAIDSSNHLEAYLNQTASHKQNDLCATVYNPCVTNLYIHNSVPTVYNYNRKRINAYNYNIQSLLFTDFHLLDMKRCVYVFSALLVHDATEQIFTMVNH